MKHVKFSANPYEQAQNATVRAGKPNKVQLYRGANNARGNRRSLGRTAKLIARHRAGKCGCDPRLEHRCKAVKDLHETWGSWGIQDLIDSGEYTQE